MSVTLLLLDSNKKVIEIVQTKNISKLECPITEKLPTCVQSLKVILRCLGRGGGLVVIVLTLNSDYPSLNPAEVKKHFCKNV